MSNDGFASKDGLDLLVDAGVATLTLNRPDRMNALSRRTILALLEAIEHLEAAPDVRAVIMTGSGSRAFCAGIDLKETGKTDRFSPPMGGVHRNFLEALAELGKPTIAAINGVAAGGGCELALACDIRLAASTATMGLPEARVGMGANFGSVMLPRLIARGLAMELLYTGRLIGMDEAARIGLVNRVVAPPALLASATALAQEIADNAPLTVRRMKAVATKGWGLPPAAALRLSVGPDPYNSEDRLEGVRAFVEKRKPAFRGR